MTNPGTHIAGAWLLALAAATGCAADDGSDGNVGTDPPGDRAMREPAAPVALEGSSHAAYEATLDRLYVAVGPVLHQVQLPDGEPADFFAAEGPIVALDVSGQGVVLLSELDEARGRLTRIAHGGNVELELEIAMTSPGAGFAADPVFRRVGAETVVIVNGLGNPGAQTIVVNLSSKEIESSDSAVYAFLYQDPGIGVRDGRLFVPSAYPGEVIEVGVAADRGLHEIRRVNVNEDWLHDVAMLGENRALVAGHLAGIGVVELVDTPGFDGAPYTPLSDVLWAYSFVGEDHAYSASNASVVCIDTGDLGTWTLDVPGFDAPEPGSQNATAPVGERAPGRVLVHQPGAGIVEVDCGAARP